jgi:hypothetical protein
VNPGQASGPADAVFNRKVTLSLRVVPGVMRKLSLESNADCYLQPITRPQAREGGREEARVGCRLQYTGRLHTPLSHGPEVLYIKQIPAQLEVK